MVKKGFPHEEGPFVESLDEALKTFHVERQAYYGGTFVGKHIHTTLKVYDIQFCSLTSSYYKGADTRIFPIPKNRGGIFKEIGRPDRMNMSIIQEVVL